MVRIRLRRTGKKKQPSYRVVVADSEAPRDGRFIENIGFYNPRTDPSTVEIDADRALYWLSQGAQPSEAVARLLRKEGVLERFEALKSGKAVTEPVEPAETEAEVKAVSEAQAVAQVEAEAEAMPEAAAESEVEAEAVPEEAPGEEAGAESTSEEEIEAEPEGELAAEEE